LAPRFLARHVLFVDHLPAWLHGKRRLAPLRQARFDFRQKTGVSSAEFFLQRTAQLRSGAHMEGRKAKNRRTR